MVREIPKAGDMCTKCEGGWTASDEWDIRCGFCRDGVIQPSFKETEYLRAELGHAKDLLACMHGDGGHHTAAVGFRQSCADATERYYKLVTELDKAHQRIEDLIELVGNLEKETSQ